MDPLKSIGSIDPARRALSVLDEFKDFALKGNVVDLAVGVIIGAAFGKIVDSLVKQIIMPLVGLLLPGDQGYLGWKIAVGAKEVPYGLFLGEIRALPFHREVSRLDDESKAVGAARPVEGGAAARRDPRSAEGAEGLKAPAGNYSAFTPIARTSFPHLSTSPAR